MQKTFSLGSCWNITTNWFLPNSIFHYCRSSIVLSAFDSWLAINDNVIQNHEFPWKLYENWLRSTDMLDVIRMLLHESLCRSKTILEEESKVFSFCTVQQLLWKRSVSQQHLQFPHTLKSCQYEEKSISGKVNTSAQFLPKSNNLCICGRPDLSQDRCDGLTVLRERERDRQKDRGPTGRWTNWVNS